MKMSKKGFIILGYIFLSLVTSEALARPACPKLFELKQPTGTVFSARAFGDEWYNGMETAEGYTILKDTASGFWVYALKAASGELYPSNLVVGIDLPEGISKHLRDEIALQRMFSTLQGIPFKAITPPGWWRTKGKLRVLVLLVEFTDQKLVGSESSDWGELFFGGSGSVKDYFKEVSYDQLEIIPAEEKQGIKNDGIVKITLDVKHPNEIGPPSREAVKKALIAADKYVVLSKLDLNGNGAISSDEVVFVIVCAGYVGEYFNPKKPNIWSHAWSFYGSVPAPTLDGIIVGAYEYWGGFIMIGEWMESVSSSTLSSQSAGRMQALGAPTHEMGHDFGLLPDLYDTDYSSTGIGDWGLMGDGSWLGPKGEGDVPSHFMAWCKYFLDWIDPKLLKIKEVKGIDSVNKKFPIKQIETSKNKALYLLGNNPKGAEYGGKGEYFLLENRQQVGYDRFLPGSGLLIWHIDERKGDNDKEGHKKKRHRLVDLEEADGLNELDSKGGRSDDGDTFPGSTNNRTFTNSTKPDSKWYNGKDSKIRITSISNSKKKMTATISTEGKK